jgi:hypothetical protein
MIHERYAPRHKSAQHPAAMKLDDDMPTSTTPNQDQTTTHSLAAWQPIDDWTVLTGQDVEVHTHDSVSDRGRVEAVVAD